MTESMLESVYIMEQAQGHLLGMKLSLKVWKLFFEHTPGNEHREMLPKELLWLKKGIKGLGLSPLQQPRVESDLSVSNTEEVTSACIKPP